MNTPAVTTLEGTAYCASCNTEASILSEEDAAELDRVQQAAEDQAEMILTLLKAQAPE